MSGGLLFVFVVSLIGGCRADDDGYYGIRSPTFPPIELFGGDFVQRLVWSEPNERPMCLIDWSAPDTTWQPFGTRNCTETGQVADQGEYWLLSKRKNMATKKGDFLGLIGNQASGRCMQWRPRPAKSFPHASQKEAITWGTLTSEVCNETNEYQHFSLRSYMDPHLTHGIIPKKWNHKCPEGMEPTIIGGPLPSLIAYGCGKGKWFRLPVSAEWGWPYQNITTNLWQIAVDRSIFSKATCCKRDNAGKKESFCKETYSADGNTQPVAQWWGDVCRSMFSNYRDYDASRPGVQESL
ncbi:hypothetical protein H072_5165 [Dactylellina haptotyla CBS 200.50]|uniref:Uncharacterized protein n=1 Tax=Dactylellina haptotyla (strain CBS 200.50) TaxID=1284197 RepID=S8ADA5_DACHA|nr:hypothetical protein H072_5165 [Dactylellina haptotyla CBS 200.50]